MLFKLPVCSELWFNIKITNLYKYINIFIHLFLQRLNISEYLNVLIKKKAVNGSDSMSLVSQVTRTVNIFFYNICFAYKILHDGKL